ncbi:hypothetical protein BcepSauron_005 [Burkholderia phage BcepSauron]|uniref:Uncharacterized protein n=1 Tax=Burkholderia phage BcepSauron TaxID=2530033 RepID=A0A482ML93_9CAUD|nr:hypothetical protein H1O17_gp005 [Burkholderia phage BcepSauron]QBQ74385.1 hypothetical protein BcepSauron_005 [Burkholderia phage BcepSauron]
MYKASPVVKSGMAVIDGLLAQATEHALTMIEREARRVLRGPNRAASFCMGMGSASFSDKNGNLLDDDYPPLSSVMAILAEFDHALKLTGTPMKIEHADGPALHDW